MLKMAKQPLFMQRVDQPDIAVRTDQHDAGAIVAKRGPRGAGRILDNGDNRQIDCTLPCRQDRDRRDQTRKCGVQPFGDPFELRELVRLGEREKRKRRVAQQVEEAQRKTSATMAQALDIRHAVAGIQLEAGTAAGQDPLAGLGPSRSRADPALSGLSG